MSHKTAGQVRAPRVEALLPRRARSCIQNTTFDGRFVRWDSVVDASPGFTAASRRPARNKFRISGSMGALAVLLAGGSGTAGEAVLHSNIVLSTDTSIQDIPTAVHFFSGSLVRRVREIGWLNGRICKVGTPASSTHAGYP